MRRSAIGLSLAALALAAAVPAAGGQGRQARLFLAAGAGWPGQASSYAFQYDPHPGYSPAGSTAGQTLSIEPAAGFGLEAGLLLPLGRAVDLRLGLGWSRTPLGGENGPFTMLFKYSIPVYAPPWEPIPTSLSESTDWFPTFGSLRQAGLGLELAVRLPVARGVDVALTAGPRLALASGRLGGLGYTEYLGSSHGAPLFQRCVLTLTLPAELRILWSAGLEAVFRLSSFLSLSLRAGYATGSLYVSVPEIETIGYYWGLTSVPADQVGDRLARLELPAIELSLRRLGLAVGLVFDL